MKHILVAYDGWRPAQRAFDFGLTLAGRWDTAAEFFGRWLVGSVSKQVMHCARCTTTIVR